MSSSTFEFSFGENDRKMDRKPKRFKAEKDKKYRVSFVTWPTDSEGKPIFTDANGENTNPRFLGCERHWVDKVGYVVSDGPDYVTNFGKAKLCVGTVIAVWPIDGKGELLKNALHEVQVLPFLIDTYKYQTLRDLQADFSFADTDLQITCTDEKFQKYSFANKKLNMYRELSKKENPELVEITTRIRTEANEIFKALPDEMAKKMTMEDIAKALNGPAGLPSASASSTPSVSSADIEDTLADLLG